MYMCALCMLHSQKKLAGRQTDLEELLDFITLSEVYGSKALVVGAIYQ